MAVFVIDANYVTLSLLICIAWQLLFFLFAAGFKIDKVTDFAYGTNFAVLAIVTFFLNGAFFVRQIVVSLLVLLWAIRISSYLLRRILHIKEDERFDEFREHPLIFLRFWVLQMIVVFAVSLPYVFLNAKHYDVPLNWRDYLGWTLFGLGWLIETVSDHQKFTFRNITNNDDHWCDVGFWRWSRHPNYFGEFLVWWGIFASSSSVFYGADYATVVSPVLLFLVVMFISGSTRLEKSADERYWPRKDYQRYKSRTSLLIPLPPIFYGIFPRVVKYFLCEWGIYWNPQMDNTETIAWANDDKPKPNTPLVQSRNS